MNDRFKFRYVIKAESGIFFYDVDLSENPDLTIDFIYEDLEENYKTCHCFTESQNHCECEPLFEGFEIIAKLQCTGLKDKNGKWIYEGDIVRCYVEPDYENYVSEISRDGSTLCIDVHNQDYGITSIDFAMGNEDILELEIIGNTQANNRKNDSI